MPEVEDVDTCILCVKLDEANSTVLTMSLVRGTIPEPCYVCAAWLLPAPSSFSMRDEHEAEGKKVVFVCKDCVAGSLRRHPETVPDIELPTNIGEDLPPDMAAIVKEKATDTRAFMRVLDNEQLADFLEER